MKLLIIDDEAHVRRALHLIIQKADLGVTEIFEAADAGRAMELIHEKNPEIIISDVVMPEMTGIQLIEQLKQSHPHSKTIIISGHNDFKYVRSALRAGSIDYLLKPLSREQIANAVTNAVNCWKNDFELRRQVQENNDEVSQLSSVYRRDLLSRMIYESLSAEEYGKLKKQMPWFPPPDGCRIGVMAFPHLLHLSGQIPLLTQATIEETIQQFMEQKAINGIVFSNQKAFTECIILMPKEISDPFNQIQKLVEERISCYLPIGQSVCLCFPEELPNAYSQALQSIQKTPLSALQPGSEECYGLPMSCSLPDIKLPHAFSKEMFSAILSGNTKIIRDHAGKWTDLLSDSNRTLDDISSLLRQYEAMKLSVLSDIKNVFSKSLQSHWKPASQLPLPFDAHGHFQPQLMVQLIDADLTDLSNQFQLNQGKENSVIQSVILYMKDHYQEDINQAKLADHFFISRDYLSHKFKEETGMGMVHYLNLLRIEKAKELLLLPDARVNDVAASVGYNDEKYFCKVFKKYELLSPSQYRDKLFKPQ